MENKTDLDALDRLHAAATKGEWWAADNSCYCEIRSEQGQIGDMCASCHIPDIDGDNRELSTANAKCAAALKNAYPALAAELREARKRVRELEAEIEVRDDSANLVFDTLKAALPNRGFHSEMEAAEAAAKEIAELRQGIESANGAAAHYLSKITEAQNGLDARDRRMKALGAAEELRRIVNALQAPPQYDLCAAKWAIVLANGEDHKYLTAELLEARAAELEAEAVEGENANGN
jgi:hypothetical protein